MCLQKDDKYNWPRECTNMAKPREYTVHSLYSHNMLTSKPIINDIMFYNQMKYRELFSIYYINVIIDKL